MGNSKLEGQRRRVAVRRASSKTCIANERFVLAPQVGFEPTTLRLTAAILMPKNKGVSFLFNEWPLQCSTAKYATLRHVFRWLCYRFRYTLPPLLVDHQVRAEYLVAALVESTQSVEDSGALGAVSDHVFARRILHRGGLLNISEIRDEILHFTQIAPTAEAAAAPSVIQSFVSCESIASYSGATRSDGACCAKTFPVFCV